MTSFPTLVISTIRKRFSISIDDDEMSDFMAELEAEQAKVRAEIEDARNKSRAAHRGLSGHRLWLSPM